MTPGPELHEQRFYDLIGKKDAFTDADLISMRECLHYTNYNMVRPHVLGKTELRVDLELIESLRRFDNASGKSASATNDLAEKTRLLTIRIFWLTVVLVSIGT